MKTIIQSKKGNRKMSSSPFKQDCVAGRVALITGGGSGIGFGIAKTLGQHGAKIVIMGRRLNFLQDACEQLKKLNIEAIPCQGDVRSEESAANAVQTCLDKFGRLDILVNSAAGNFLALAEDLSVKGFRTVMEIDTVGVYNMSKHSFEALKASGSGVIINISATLHYGATWYQTHATAAKAAIDSITRQLALEWGTFNIRVNGIAPGPIADTPGLTKLSASDSDKWIRKQVPLGRAGTTTDIGLTALFLSTNAASYISGDTLIVDGAAWLYQPPPIPRQQVSEHSRQIESKSRAQKAKL